MIDATEDVLGILVRGTNTIRAFTNADLVEDRPIFLDVGRALLVLIYITAMISVPRACFESLWSQRIEARGPEISKNYHIGSIKKLNVLATRMKVIALTVLSFERTLL
jgi:hypothetical protein